MERFVRHQATVAPVNDVKSIIEDEHVIARENIVALDDPELGGRLRMQNVVGKLSRTPGAVKSSGPRLGAHNREILVEMLGYDEDRLAAAGIDLAAEPVQKEKTS
jgi:crotonobetainyl-CoA:carnitine CoA-transferase CaiB-like acyl-CoA transferase